MRASLSVAIITLNEERNLPACLESVRWAEEVVVCDSGSQDRTLEIARQRGARTYQGPLAGVRRPQEPGRRAVRHAVGAGGGRGRACDPELRAAIERVLADPAAADGYWVPRRNFFLGRWIRGGGWHPDATIRLFRRGRGRFAERAVHEAVEVGGQVGYLQAPLEHFTYDSIGAYLTRMDRYSTLAAMELHRGGRRRARHGSDSAPDLHRPPDAVLPGRVAGRLARADSGRAVRVLRLQQVRQAVGIGLGAECRVPGAAEQAQSVKRHAPCAEPAEPRAANRETPPGA